MALFLNALRLFALVVFAVAATHFLLGPNAEVLLGSGISDAAVFDTVLDSQNRFYGTCFALFGVILWLSAGDIEKYRVVFNWLLLFFFAGGVSRWVFQRSGCWALWRRN